MGRGARGAECSLPCYVCLHASLQLDYRRRGAAIRPDRAGGNLVIPLNDDWKTRGNWIDHYGRMYADLFSMVGFNGCAGYDSSLFACNDLWVDRHWNKTESARQWRVGGQDNTADPRALQDNIVGGRTDANSDDHGESYPTTEDGPDLYWTCMVPAGGYIMSAYLYNDDGHQGSPERCRDYIVQVSVTAANPAYIRRLPTPGCGAAAWFDRGRPTAVARCNYFCEGVYKRFFVQVRPCYRGPHGNGYGVITLRVRRNYSFNAILEGAFLDATGRCPRSAAPHGFVQIARQKSIKRYRRRQANFPDIFGNNSGASLGPPATVAAATPREMRPAIALMQQAMYLRRANGAWFAARFSPCCVELVRYLRGTIRAGHPLLYFLSQRIWGSINSRCSLAGLVRTIPAPDLADKIYFAPDRFLGYAYHYMSVNHLGHGPKEGGRRFYRKFARWTILNMRKELLCGSERIPKMPR